MVEILQSNMSSNMRYSLTSLFGGVSDSLLAKFVPLPEAVWCRVVHTHSAHPLLTRTWPADLM